MRDELTQAWDEALDAPGDTGRWRLLADALLAAGQPQGELMQLELDAEAGPLKGLARGRLERLKDELQPTLVPAGAPLPSARFFRGALVECWGDLGALHRAGADEPRWQSVQRLVLGDELNGRHDVVRLAPLFPLTGRWLRHVQVLKGLRLELLELIAAGPVRERLTEVSIWDHGWNHTPPSHWAARWSELATRAPRLARVRFDGVESVPGLMTTRLVRDWLTPLLDRDLERVTIGGGFGVLAAAWRWVCEARPSWTLVSEPHAGSMAIAVKPDALEVFTSSPARLEEEVQRINHRGTYGIVMDTEALIRAAWPAAEGLPPPIRLRGLG